MERPLNDTPKLKKCSLFNGLGDVLLKQIEAGMQWEKLQIDEMLCHKGDPSDGLYVVASGSLIGYDLLHNGQEVPLFAMGEGAFLGEMGVIDRHPRAAYVRATLPSVVGLLPQSQAAALFYEQPLVAQRVMAFLASKVREMTLQRMLLGIPNVFERLCAWLVHEARPGHSGVPMIALLPRQQDLANMLNTSRETVSRSLARLVRDRVIEKSPSGIRVLQPERLRRLAQSESLPAPRPAHSKLV